MEKEIEEIMKNNIQIVSTGICWDERKIYEDLKTLVQSQQKTEWISVEYKMSDKKFCELKTAYTGEKIDNINQLVKSCFSGEELKEFLEFVINQVTKNE